MGATPLLAIVGPTAVGKSRLALHLAESLDGEIVNADSRQIYKYMDIGTAKPPNEERIRVPHHLFDIREPDQEYSLAVFLDMANHTINDIKSRDKLPIAVGGSGQYIWALLEGWKIPAVAPNPTLRADLEFQVQRRGPWALYQLLQAVNPKKAEKIDPKNARRIIRALEVHFISGSRSPQLGVMESRPETIMVIGLTTDRRELYCKIDTRVDRMMSCGFVEEVQTLLDRGYSPQLSSMSGVGYHEIAAYLRGSTAFEDALQQIKYRTHRIARRQYTWFRLKDQRIRWIQSDGQELNVGMNMAQEFIMECDKIASDRRIETDEVH